MLVVFHSKAAADVLMLSAHARQVLQAAGKVLEDALPERGVFTPEQLPAAIALLEQVGTISADPAESDQTDPGQPPKVGLRQRAWPLLDMLRKAQRKGQSVIWEPAAAW